MTKKPTRPDRVLRSLFDAALSAADPLKLEFPQLPRDTGGRVVVAGAGKAAATMAASLERQYNGPLQGIVVTPYGHGYPCRSVEVVEAAHPVPDRNGQAAAARILELVRGLDAEDELICLLSGGASALLCMPAPGISLKEKQVISRRLLTSGADIHEINCVRKHLSAVKGGRLAAEAFPAAVHTFAISDVPGDALSAIGSGPTIGDPTTCRDAQDILERYAVAVSSEVGSALSEGRLETPKPGDPELERSTIEIVARPFDALKAAAAAARSMGLSPVVLGDAIEGEAREVARVMAGIAVHAAAHGEPAAPPCVLLSGGETTVTVRGSGKGGRNTEFLLALGIALNGHPRVHAIACDTDGIDGGGDNAGALLFPDSLERLVAQGLKPRSLLEENDGYRAFEALGDLIMTGPTRTNVNDFRAILVGPA